MHTFLSSLLWLWCYTIQHSHLFWQMSKQSWYGNDSFDSYQVLPLIRFSLALDKAHCVLRSELCMSYKCPSPIFSDVLPVFRCLLCGNCLLLISCHHTEACTVCDVLSNTDPLGFPDLKSKHTALLWAMLSCGRNSCLHESLMYAHIGIPLKQMRMWRITSIPDLSCFKSLPFQNVKRLIHWSTPLKNVTG